MSKTNWRIELRHPSIDIKSAEDKVDILECFARAIKAQKSNSSKFKYSDWGLFLDHPSLEEKTIQDKVEAILDASESFKKAA